MSNVPLSHLPPAAMAVLLLSKSARFDAVLIGPQPLPPMPMTIPGCCFCYESQSKRLNLLQVPLNDVLHRELIFLTGPPSDLKLGGGLLASGWLTVGETGGVVVDDGYGGSRVRKLANNFYLWLSEVRGFISGA